MRTIDTINSTMLVAIELSASSWLVAPRVPRLDKPHLHRVDGGDTLGLLAVISSLRDRVAHRLNVAIGVVCCFEAGRDGFWLHRLPAAHGLTNYVLDPTSILIHRRARRAKTDRLDAIGILRVLTAYLRGDRRAAAWYGCLHQMRKMPSASTGSASLVQERLRIENRTEALLFTQGIRKRPSLRSWKRDLSVLRTGNGREMPRHLRAELDRLKSTTRHDLGVDPGGRG